MRIHFLLVYVVIITYLLSSCGSIVPQQPQITEDTSIAIPDLKGTVKIPLEINLQPYFDLADKSIPKTFRGKEEQCDGVSFQYYFNRQPINFSGFKKTLSYKIAGEYNIRANYCAQCSSVFGSNPFCLTPRIYVSCGVGEPLRKIEIDFESELSIAPNYSLISKTKLKSVLPLDPCELTFFRYDASKLIENEMSDYLREMETEIDNQIGKIDLLSAVSEAWKAMQEAIVVPDLGYLYFQPRAIEIEPITFDKQKAKMLINMELSPIFSSDTLVRVKPSLPYLSKISSQENFNLPLLTLVSYDSLNSLLKKQVNGLIIPLKKKKIVITNATALGPVGTKLLFRIEFTGSKKGTLYLLGTPTYDAQTNEISFPDLTFDIRSRDAILKSAKWLFDKKLTESFRSNAKYELTNQLELARKEIELQINNPIEYQKNKFVYLSGKLSKLQVMNIQIGANELRVGVHLEGNLSLKL